MEEVRVDVEEVRVDVKEVRVDVEEVRVDVEEVRVDVEEVREQQQQRHIHLHELPVGVELKGRNTSCSDLCGLQTPVAV